MKNGPAYVLFFKKAGDIFFKKVSHEGLRQYLIIIFFGVFLYLIALIIAVIFNLFYVFIEF